MGVTGFYLALTKMFPSAAKKIAIRSGRATLISDNRRIPFSPDFMHLLFDCNSELYSAAGRLGEDELDHMSAKLWESLDSLINAVSSPSPSSIFLALDGPAPHAKLYSQRSRRMRKSELPEGFDSVAFTPGSAVMRHVKESLVYYCCKRLTDNPKYSNTQFFVSGADREGEGEFKLFEHLAHIPPTKKRESCVIIGNDSDLVLFALSCKSSYRLHVLRTLKHSGQFELWDIDELRAAILKTCSSSNTAPDKVISDFVTLSLLRGNDYLPRLRNIGFHQLWHRYCSSSNTHPLVDVARLAPDWTALKQLWATSARQSSSSHMREKALQHLLDQFSPKIFLTQMYERVDSTKPLRFAADEVDTSNGGDELPFSCVMLLGDQVLASARGLTGRQASVLVAARKLRELVDAGDAICLQLAASASMPPEQIRRFCNELIALLEPPPSSSNSNSQKQKKKQSQSVDEEAEKKKLAAVGIIDEMSDASSGSESSVAADNTAEDADLDETTGRADHSLADHSKARLQSYLLGVVWAHMYYSGDCLDYTWSFAYASAPSFAELADSKEYPLNFPRKINTTPLYPIECLLLLMPPNRKALLPAAFRSIPDQVPELSATLMGDKWRTPEKILDTIRAHIDKISSQLSTELRNETLAFRPTMCLSLSSSPRTAQSVSSSASSSSQQNYSLGHGHFPSLWRISDVFCTVENRTMITPRLYDIPYTCDKGNWHSGRWIGKADSQPQQPMKRKWNSTPHLPHHSKISAGNPMRAPQPPPASFSSRPVVGNASSAVPLRPVPPVKTFRTSPMTTKISATRVLLNLASKLRL